MVEQRSVGTATPTTVVAKPLATEHVLTVGDVASLGGVTVSTVRFYETEQLIHGTRTAGNQCPYGPVSSTYASFK
ncbi:MerR family DNA-binding transcriptional regulator [Achromobacter xylosoxidans]|uniref:MerR family DNA-binding transcriptional regulator n=1 Tax=Alcaligenes xylosoxydans xylosoxydans TaxID=85698 RepID=UPI003F60CAA0